MREDGKREAEGVREMRSLSLVELEAEGYDFRLETDPHYVVNVDLWYFGRHVTTCDAITIGPLSWQIQSAVNLALFHANRHYRTMCNVAPRAAEGRQTMESLRNRMPITPSRESFPSPPPVRIAERGLSIVRPSQRPAPRLTRFGLFVYATLLALVGAAIWFVVGR